MSACWLVRAVALFLLLGTLGIGFSFSLALLFLCAGAAAAALPIGPAGAATQAGASGAALIATGIAASQALSVAVSVGALGVLSGSAIFLFAVAWRRLAFLACLRGQCHLRPDTGERSRPRVVRSVVRLVRRIQGEVRPTAHGGVCCLAPTLREPFPNATFEISGLGRR